MNNHTATIPMEEYLKLIALQEQVKKDRETNMTSKALLDLILYYEVKLGNDTSKIRTPYLVTTENFKFQVGSGHYNNPRKVTYMELPAKKETDV